MPVNKVVINDSGILDLTGDSVTPATLAKGVTAHDKSGAKITGVLEVPTAEEKIVELSMPSGNQIIEPSSEKVLSKVTVQKPTTLVSENIKNGIEIGGVVGTLESGAGEEDGILTKTVTSYTNDRITSLGDYALAYCSKLTSVSFANVQTVGNSALRDCSLLTSVTLPKAATLDNSALRNNAALTSLDLPLCSYITGYAFYGCEALAALVLRYTAGVCYLANKNAFTYTPIAYNTGYIYVPDALVDSYKSATNWSTYGARIKALSEYAG